MANGDCDCPQCEDEATKTCEECGLCPKRRDGMPLGSKLQGAEFAFLCACFPDFLLAI